jgi:hypothetical protein
MTKQWRPVVVDADVPPDGEVVDTFSPSGIQQQLKRRKRLWFTPDGEMYVDYVPAFWHPIKGERSVNADLLEAAKRLCERTREELRAYVARRRDDAAEPDTSRLLLHESELREVAQDSKQVREYVRMMLLRLDVLDNGLTRVEAAHRAEIEEPDIMDLLGHLIEEHGLTKVNRTFAELCRNRERNLSGDNGLAWGVQAALLERAAAAADLQQI